MRMVAMTRLVALFLVLALLIPLIPASANSYAVLQVTSTKEEYNVTIKVDVKLSSLSRVMLKDRPIPFWVSNVYQKADGTHLEVWIKIPHLRANTTANITLIPSSFGINYGDKHAVMFVQDFTEMQDLSSWEIPPNLTYTLNENGLAVMAPTYTPGGGLNITLPAGLLYERPGNLTALIPWPVRIEAIRMGWSIPSEGSVHWGISAGNAYIQVISEPPAIAQFVYPIIKAKAGNRYYWIPSVDARSVMDFILEFKDGQASAYIGGRKLVSGSSSLPHKLELIAWGREGYNWGFTYVKEIRAYRIPRGQVSTYVMYVSGPPPSLQLTLKDALLLLLLVFFLVAVAYAVRKDLSHYRFRVR